MQSISEIMTRDVTVLAPGDTLQQAAQIMRDWNIGAIPVCDGKHLTGMLTDRDIAIRAVAEGKLLSETCVREVVSSEVLWCFEDQTIGEVLQQMGDQQIRRLPVLSRNMELTGMVSLGDLATRQPAQTGSALEDISAPTPSARQALANILIIHDIRSAKLQARFGKEAAYLAEGSVSLLLGLRTNGQPQ